MLMSHLLSFKKFHTDLMKYGLMYLMIYYYKLKILYVITYSYFLKETFLLLFFPNLRKHDKIIKLFEIRIKIININFTISRLNSGRVRRIL